MRQAWALVLLAAATGGFAPAAGRGSWNKIRYIGGTPSIKGGSYDWDTTVTLEFASDTVELVVAPPSAFGRQQKLSIKVSRITAVVNGPGAWERVASVPGTHLPPKPHGLFGLLNRDYPVIGRHDKFLAILYQGDDDKPAAILLGCDYHIDATLGQALAGLAGKSLEHAK